MNKSQEEKCVHEQLESQVSLPVFVMCILCFGMKARVDPLKHVCRERERDPIGETLVEVTNPNFSLEES